MLIRLNFVFLILVLHACVYNDQFDYLLELDRQEYGAKSLNQSYIEELYGVWNSAYNTREYPVYLSAIESLMDSGYFNTASSFSDQVDTTLLSPQELSKLYLFRGEINMMQSNANMAIKYFHHAFIEFPIFPEEIGYNRLKYYNNAVFTLLDSEKCDEGKMYFDSLQSTAEQYPDLLYYIGGNSRIEDYQMHIEKYCGND